MLSNIRTQALAAALLFASQATASQICMSCRRQDINAGFLVSYSYCEQSNECV